MEMASHFEVDLYHFTSDSEGSACSEKDPDYYDVSDELFKDEDDLFQEEDEDEYTPVSSTPVSSTECRDDPDKDGNDDDDLPVIKSPLQKTRKK